MNVLYFLQVLKGWKEDKENKNVCNALDKKVIGLNCLLYKTTLNN